MIKKLCNSTYYFVITTIFSIICIKDAIACSSIAYCDDPYHCYIEKYIPGYISYILFAVYILAFCYLSIKTLNQKETKSNLSIFSISIIAIATCISVIYLLANTISKNIIWSWKLYNEEDPAFILENFLFFFPVIFLSALGIKKLKKHHPQTKLTKFAQIFLYIICLFPLFIPLLLCLEMLIISITKPTQFSVFYNYMTLAFATLAFYKIYNLNLQKNKSKFYWLLYAFAVFLTLDIAYVIFTYFHNIPENKFKNIFYTMNARQYYILSSILLLQLVTYGIIAILHHIKNQNKLTTFINKGCLFINKFFVILAVLYLTCAILVSFLTTYTTFLSYC